METHCTPDVAAEQVVRNLEEIFAKLGESSREHRPHITHCQIASPNLIERMARLGVVVNIQPSFVPSDAKWIENRLSASNGFDYNRLEYSYAWKKLLNAGIYVSG